MPLAINVSRFERSGIVDSTVQSAVPKERTIASMRRRAIRSIVSLIGRAGEIPLDGAAGVLLPPFDTTFFADELGCRPAQALQILEGLLQEGFLVPDGSRIRVPDPGAINALISPGQAISNRRTRFSRPDGRP